MRGFILGVIATLVLLPAGLVALVRSGRIPIRADEAPPWWETKVASIAFDAGLARYAPKIPNPVLPTDKNLATGARLYRGSCAGCHGGPEKGENLFARSLYPRAPQFPDHPTALPDYEIFWVTRHGIRRTGMPAWGALLKDDEIWAIAGFLERIDRLPAAAQSAWKEPIKAGH